MNEEHEIALLIGSGHWERPPGQEGAVPPYLEQAYARASVADSLAKRPEPSIRALAALTRAAMSDEDDGVREAAIRALAIHSAPSGITLVMAGATFDPDSNVRWTALGLLRQLDRQVALQFARAMVLDEDVAVSEYARSLLDEPTT